MRLRLHNAGTRRVEDFRPQLSPVCRLLERGPDKSGDLESFRWDVLSSYLKSSLEYLGYRIEPAERDVDLYFGDVDGAGVGGVWLKPGAFSAEMASLGAVWARGFDSPDLRLAIARAGAWGATRLSWDCLDQARAERRELCEIVQRLRLRPGASSPNPTGLAGYKKRFRDALANALDYPGALAMLWDALRPGALSPGSMIAAMAQADRVFGLGLKASC